MDKKIYLGYLLSGKLPTFYQVDTDGRYIYGKKGTANNMFDPECTEFRLLKDDSNRYDSILEEAKKRYPIGTVYRPLQADGDTFSLLEYKATIECKWWRSGTNPGIECGEGLVYINGKWAEVISKPESQSIDYDAILEEAKRRYPIGTKYKPLDTDGNVCHTRGTRPAQFECVWYLRKDENDDYDGIECGDGYVYLDGKWAEVISEPEPKSKPIDYDAILEEAKRRYPIYTEYKALDYDGTVRGGMEVACRECKWVYNDGKHYGIDCGLGYVYVNGKWAELADECYGKTGIVDYGLMGEPGEPGEDGIDNRLILML